MDADRAALRARVQSRIGAFLAERAEVLAELGPELAPPMQVLAGLTGGGKLLRPAFCYWGYRAAGGIDDSSDRGIISAAAALELLHVSALIHDDVMDASDRRRGVPAAHVQLARGHRDAGWAGDPDRFGAAAAVLLGDLCLGWADEMLRGAALPPAQILAGLEVYERMRTEVMGGQYLDLVAQADVGATSVTRSTRVLHFKTAKYSVERPLHLGVALAGGGPELTGALSAFGVPLGEAFQLRDDLLGVFGDPLLTGKPAGDDLREGKRTVLAATALDLAAPAERATLERLLGDPLLDEAGVETLRAILESTGAREGVEKLIDARSGEAGDALALAPIRDPAARDALAGLVDAVIRRDS
ncbi:MAG: polyprenyl synthetase family protein [Sporichthyaceae bacterium]